MRHATVDPTALPDLTDALQAPDELFPDLAVVGDAQQDGEERDRKREEYLGRDAPHRRWADPTTSLMARRAGRRHGPPASGASQAEGFTSKEAVVGIGRGA